MLPADFQHLDIGQYELRLQAQQETSLPTFLGSTLRGAFGHALKNAVCVMNHRDCDRCLVLDSCLYPYLFETPAPPTVEQLRGQQQAPHPFILSPPAILSGYQQQPIGQAEPSKPANSKPANSSTIDQSIQTIQTVQTATRYQFKKNEELLFNLLLIGKSIDYLPYIVYAISEMARHGLGVGRAPFELIEAMALLPDGIETIYHTQARKISIPSQPKRSLSELITDRINQFNQPDQSNPSSDRKSIKLRFITPARIRVEGDLQSGLSFQQLIRNLLRRISLLSSVHGRAPLTLDFRGLIQQAEAIKVSNAQLSWCDLERYSNRQQTKMKLGGFIGEIEYCGENISLFFPLIVAGELLHIGTSTSFGLGKYQLMN